MGLHITVKCMDESSTPLYVQFLAGPDADHTSGLRCNDVQSRAVVILMFELSGIGSFDFIACERCDDKRSGSEN